MERGGLPRIHSVCGKGYIIDESNTLSHLSHCPTPVSWDKRDKD